MQGVLQSSSLACRGGILQPAHTAPPQRLVPPRLLHYVLCDPSDIVCFIWILQFDNTYGVACSGVFTYYCALENVSVLCPEYMDPLKYQHVYHQKYILNERGKVLM